MVFLSDVMKWDETRDEPRADESVASRVALTAGAKVGPRVDESAASMVASLAVLRVDKLARNLVETRAAWWARLMAEPRVMTRVLMSDRMKGKRTVVLSVASRAEMTAA